MATPDAADDRYQDACVAVSAGRFTAAEEILGTTLDKAPRAAQSLYLMGVVVLLQGRYAEARKTLDHAYRVKAWLRDLPLAVFDLWPAAELALAADPGWLWPRYELERRAFYSVGLTLPNVVRAHLARADVSFIEVGANDGVRSDPVHEFVVGHRWSGLCIEPMPDTYRSLEATYADNPRVATAMAAVSGTDGRVTMYVAETSTLATLTPERNALGKSGGQLREVEVESATFQTLMQRHEITSVDVLQIDTEGYDFEVLRTFDLHRYRPMVVNMEFYCLSLEERLACFSLLRHHGYAYRFGGMDLIAVDASRAADSFCITDRTEGRYLNEGQVIPARRSTSLFGGRR